MASQATLDRLCAEFDSPPALIAAAVALLEQRTTPAFLARYRRHELGNLPEERLHALAERLHVLSELEQRREAILQQAEERGRRTPELEQTLQLIADHDVLDDYYQSMRPRRRGLAMQMEEKGLLPLALAIQHRQFGDAAMETVLPPRPPKAPRAAAAPAADEAVAAEGVEGDAPAAPASDAQAPADEAHAGEAPAAAAPAAEAPAAEAPAAEAPAAEAPVAEATDAHADEPLPDQHQAEEAEPTVPAEGRRVPDVRLDELAAPYVDAQQGVNSPEQALEGALLILADRISHDPATRARFRDELRRGVLRAKPVDPDGNHGTYQQFFDFAEPINRIPANRMLALRRAEREKILELRLTLPDGRHRKLLRDLHARDTVPGTMLGDFYDLVFDHAAQQLQDLCGKDVRRRLKEKADREAMRTYARNLRSQLLAPPLGSKKVLSLRSSGKAIWAALLNEDGSVGEHKTMPTDSDEQKQGALALLVELIRTQSPAAIALPHGRRQAGSERILGELREALGDTPLPMVVPVDEAASTIFATSTTGKKAIPGVEVGVRTAISLGRRLQDPLLELSHMEVRTLGLGHTLDEVHQGSLHRELSQVKSACLAQVGVDLNTAPKELLELLPGLSAEQAHAIVQHRKQHGGFANREALKQVQGLDEVAWRNVVGFLRIQGGDEPLDATALHPEDYPIARATAELLGCAPIELFGKNLREVDADAVAAASGSERGHVIPVLQLMHRGNGDGRGVLMASANQGVHTLADLHADRELRGRVASLTEFGAFVDLGIGQDGLVHISQIPAHRLRDPNQMLRVGEVIDVWVISIDQEKGKISLTMLKPRHLAEGRLPTLGERMDQQQGRRGRGRGRREPEGDPAQSRRPGTGGARPGFRRGPGEGGREGGGEREGGRGFGRGRPGGDDRGPRGDRGDGGDRGPRGPRGPRDARVYTVEPAREIEEQRTHKGEVTSLASLRNLLSKGDDKKS